MRFYPRCFRFRKLLTFIVIIVLITLGVKMGNYFKYRGTVHFPFVSHTKKYIFLNPISTNFTIGAFLKGKVVTNTSYCTFRFGESGNFSYGEEDVAFGPELGDKGLYRVLYNVVEGVQVNGSDPFTVTYVTHATVEYLVHVAEIATRWDGLVSVACFLPASDALTALRHLETLCSCVPEMGSVAVHFVYPANQPPRYGLVYPVNVARNVARLGSRSEFVLVSDVELFPSEGLVPEFLSMVKRLRERSKTMGDHYFIKKRHVFVVPVFEVARDEPDVPRTKLQLLDLYDKERAVYFHRYVCLHCQRFPGLQRWLQRKVHPRTKLGAIQPLLVVKRKYPYHRWEPIYIGTNKEPLYSEVLTWEGQQDKMTQMHEMCLLDYHFVILNGAFLVHTPGIKRRQDKLALNTALAGVARQRSNRTAPSLDTMFRTATALPRTSRQWRTQHIQRNEYLYQVIAQDVVGKYKNNPKCRIH